MPPTPFDRGTRRIALCGLTTLSAVVLLFSYRTSTSTSTPADAPRAGAAPSGPDVVPAAAAPAGAAWSGTVTGPVVPVKWGDVQVRATITQGRITAVDVR